MAGMEFTFKFRRGSSTEWIDTNPLLADGEPGFELNTGKVKIGNGADRWNDLPYLAGEGSGEMELEAHVESVTPHPVYDDGPSLTLLYENAKV
jgi:hypothetical protein